MHPSLKHIVVDPTKTLLKLEEFDSCYRMTVSLEGKTYLRYEDKPGIFSIFEERPFIWIDLNGSKPINQNELEKLYQRLK